MSIEIHHPVRDAFSSCSTGSPKGNGRTGYYDTKDHAVNTFDVELLAFALYLDHPVFPGYAGRRTVDICNEHGRSVGLAVFSWFRMESGRYEFIGYIA